MLTPLCRYWLSAKIILVSLLLFTSLPTLYADNLATSLPWMYRAFGQSVDLFFANSANAPGQDGINHVWLNPTWSYRDPLYVQSDQDIAQSLAADVPIYLQDNDIIVVESRGGKIAAGHDGMTFFYTPYATDRNFILEATLTLTAAGPHPNNVGSRGKPVSAFQQQSGGGLLVRDVVSSHRRDPALEGMEELPAVANFSAAGFLGGRIVNDQERILHSGSLYRDGQSSLLGNVGVGREGLRDVQLQVGVPYRYQLERTDSGYYVSIHQLDGTPLVSRRWAGSHDLTSRVDSQQLFAGVGMMREGRMVVENLSFIDTGLNEAEPTPIPTVVSEPTLLIKSHHFSSESAYTLALFGNRDGHVKINLNDQEMASLALTANQELYHPLLLDNQTNTLTLTYFFDQDQLTLDYTITYDASRAELKQLYAAPDAQGVGTQADPASLEQAIEWLQPGQTLYLLDGVYTTPVIIEATNGGLPEQAKRIRSLNRGKVWLNTHILIQANYWHLQDLLVGGTPDVRISVTGQGTLGDAVINILGNYNTIERVVAEYGTGTGINIGNSGIFKEFFPKYNRILNSESRYNADAAGNNADGFGAKRVGAGNLFYGCIAHNNIDDGWDLFNPIDAGASDPVIIEASIAYNNARNGFKLGGEGLPAAHVVRNSLAFHNGMAGFSDNFNPGSLTLINCIAVDNGDQNFLLRDNEIFRPMNQVINSISWRNDLSTGKNDYISGRTRRVWMIVNQRFLPKTYQISREDFVSTTAPESYERGEQGEIIWGDYMRLKVTSPLGVLGTGRSALGPQQLAH